MTKVLFNYYLLLASFTFMLTLFSFHELSGQVVINEVSPLRGMVDEVGEDSDWIELLNTSNEAVDLNGYYLSDNTNNWDKWEIPELVLQPNERTVILASGEDKPYLADNWLSLVVDTDEWRYLPATAEPPFDWKLQGFNDGLWGLGNGGFGYGDEDDNTLLTNIDVLYLRKTFDLESLENLQYLLFHADYDDGYIAYLNGTEIGRSNTMIGVEGNFNEFSNDLHEAVLYQGLVPEHELYDYEQIQNLLNEGENVLAVQIHNANGTSSDFSGRFFLSVTVEENTMNLNPAPDWIPYVYSAYHTNFKLGSDEPVLLSDSEGNLIDFIDLDQGLTFGMSMGRTEDGENTICVFDTPTPWESNEGSWCYEGIEPAPLISLESGWYEGPQVATLFPSSSTQFIRYSTNGDLPTSSDAYYFSPLELQTSSVLSARAFSTGNKLPSKSRDITCIIDEDNHNLPVFSVITDSLNLWDYNEGIYVSGPNAQPDLPYFGSNFWQPWSKWSRLEYFDTEQQLQAKAEMDLEIHGGWSRAEPQKSFRFDFKSIYTGSLEYPVLSRKPFIEELGNLNIRNGGQHVFSDKIQDAIFSRIGSKTNVHNSSYEPCLLYLNGDYWGVYGIREKVDEQYLEDNFGVDEESVDLLNPWRVLAGSSSDFENAFASLMSTSPADENYYGLLTSEFDIENYIDYFVIETYIQNQDWMGIAWGLNNLKMWRPQQDGKWSYVLYDTDLAFGLFGGGPNENYLQYARTPLYPSAHSLLFDRNLDNEQFRCDFANRYADLINTIFQIDDFNTEVDDLQSLIAQAMPDHVERWESPISVNFWNNSIQNIKNYNANRIPTAREHVNSTLGFNGQVAVTLDVEPAEAGTIEISTISPEDYPWQGIYFNGCPVNISVQANEGYVFDHWGENPFIDEEDQTNEDLLVNMMFNSDFTAHFTQCNLEAEVYLSAEVNELSYTAIGIDIVDQVTWLLNGDVVGFGDSIEATELGTYSVIIESSSCIYNSEDFAFVPIGIGEFNQQAFSVWPNPASHSIKLNSAVFDLNNSILEVWNASGQMVFRKARPSGAISIDQLASGMYQLKLTDGRKSEVLRLVVD